MRRSAPLPLAPDRVAEVGTFVRTHWEKLCNVAYLSGVSPDHIEDVVQNAMARLLRTWCTVDDRTSMDVRTAAYWSVRYEIREHWRSGQPREAPLAEPVDVPDIAASERFAQRLQQRELRAFLEKLSEIDRRIFTGRYVLGYTNRELVPMLNHSALSTEIEVERHAVALRLLVLEQLGSEPKGGGE